MKTNHSEKKSTRVSDPFCDEYLIQRSAIWILLFLAVILITAIILGYVLAPRIIRILWLVISSTLLVVVLPILIFLGKKIKEYITEKK
jgi:putative exporter of polyketide antibiotics